MNNKKGSIEMLKEIAGGVCAAKGFQAAGVHCGVKRSEEHTSELQSH